MAHESTVNHEGMIGKEFQRLSLANRSRTISETPEDEQGPYSPLRPPLAREDSISTVPHPYAETPQQVTQVADDLLEDEVDYDDSHSDREKSSD
jgi:hypothetical protein